MDAKTRVQQSPAFRLSALLFLAKVPIIQEQVEPVPHWGHTHAADAQLVHANWRIRVIPVCSEDGARSKGPTAHERGCHVMRILLAPSSTC